MNLNSNVIPEAYFDIRLPSRICFATVIITALSVALLLAWFAHQTSNYVTKTAPALYVPVAGK